MSEGPFCAHLQVNWTTRQVEHGMTQGWWQCRDCKSRFIPTARAEVDVIALTNLLNRCRTVLGNMALENKGALAFFRRWQISDEPLRSDAKHLLPLIDALLTPKPTPFQTEVAP